MALFEGMQAALDRLVYNNQDLIENRQPLKFTLITCDTAEDTSQYITAFNRVVGVMAEKDCIKMRNRHIYWIGSVEWAHCWHEFCMKNYPACEVRGANIDPVIWAKYLRYYGILVEIPVGKFLSLQVVEYTFLVDFGKYHLVRKT